MRVTVVSMLIALAVVATAVAGDAKMVVLAGKDVSGEVFKRLGLPSQSYCHEQCLEEARCTGVRWGVVSGSTAGQCQLIAGELQVIEPHEIKTSDGLRIQVLAARKVSTQN
jgi:hypothetical protein